MIAYAERFVLSDPVDLESHIGVWGSSKHAVVIFVIESDHP
jgi:hypothetical protein